MLYALFTMHTKHILTAGTIINFLLSVSHKRKLRASATHQKWINWSYFYQSWLVDVFFRTRSPKSVHRTTLLLSAYLLLGTVPISCWKLLQRLKLITTKETIEHWVRSNKKELSPSKSSFLIHVFDNCEIWLYKRAIRSGNHTEIMHIISRYIVEVPVEINICANELWLNVEREEFGNWLQWNDDAAIAFTNSNFNSFLIRPRDKPLKFLLHHSASAVPRSDITFIKPLFDLKTTSNRDVKFIVDDFYMAHIAGTYRICAIVSGDFQVWCKLWFLHVRYPTKYHWLIPVPGEWHFLWHILKAIFQVYYNTILLPFSKIITFKFLDRDCKNFHYGEDLLEMVTIAVSAWIEQSLAERPGWTVTDWLESIIMNEPAYELAYACIHYFIPYWITRATIKWNSFDDMEKMWRYWTHIFIATNKNNYSTMSIRFLWMLRSLNPEVKQAYDANRVVSFSGEPGTGIPYDGLIELVCIYDNRLLLVTLLYRLLSYSGQSFHQTNEQITNNT